MAQPEDEGNDQGNSRRARLSDWRAKRQKKMIENLRQEAAQMAALNETQLSDQAISEIERPVFLASIEYLRNLQHHTMDQVGSMARWLLASLLALNGGALVLSFNSSELSGAGERVAAAVWLAGTMLAMISGFMFMKNGSIGAGYIGKSVRKLYVGIHANRVPYIDPFSEFPILVRRNAARATRVGMASGASFLAGSLIAGLYAVNWN